ncbi:hypothetical protein TrLO_g9714 [Triparma laevis f. longispina]|uniref:Uncharacterized protein n=1 Tax=Triparma laevis f. longispina TaxID=1714387 RepID=A0A9W7DXT3_9STRA|nr:hypothetical protein TrLO_g9714 [Triparma laevis f. longispina]
MGGEGVGDADFDHDRDHEDDEDDGETLAQQIYNASLRQGGGEYETILARDRVEEMGGVGGELDVEGLEKALEEMDVVERICLGPEYLKYFDGDFSGVEEAGGMKGEEVGGVKVVEKEGGGEKLKEESSDVKVDSDDDAWLDGELGI